MNMSNERPRQATIKRKNTETMEKKWSGTLHYISNRINENFRQLSQKGKRW